MAATIRVAHDFSCIWCWIGLFQARRLQQDFGVHIEWLGHELYPDDLPFPESSSAPEISERPARPSRANLALALHGMERPSAVRPIDMRTHCAHEAVEFAKQYGVADELIRRLYFAYWKDGQNIGDPDTIVRIASGLISDKDGLLRAMKNRTFAEKIIGFDDDAYASGVYYLPTFFIGEERLAEQPYHLLEEAMERAGFKKPIDSAPGIYADLHFPSGPPERPYVCINMVTTIDGKIVTGTRGESVMDLGSEIDHLVMRRIENAVDGVIIGAGSLRATPGLWYPKELFRFVVTSSGRCDFDSRFFTDAPEKAFVVTANREVEFPGHVQVIHVDPCSDAGEADLRQALFHIKNSLAVRTLLVEGGSELNAQVLALGFVDELFLTLAPKIKLGRETPTYADGDALDREHIQNYRLLSEHQVGDELFIRYRRKWVTIG